MKLILSRKGFDSSSGGCPSPIFPDGSLQALPIPDERSAISYGEIQFNLNSGDGTVNIGSLVEDLTQYKTKGKMGSRLIAQSGAHLDPDLVRSMYPRKSGWKPVLGQTSSAQGHLQKQGVSEGDIFLYFGLFREVEQVEGHWQFVKQAPAKHVMWGWMQIGKIHKVDEVKTNHLGWARYHPHFQWQGDKHNTLYVAQKALHMHGENLALPGAGVFPVYNQDLQLSRDGGPSPTHWALPQWFYPYSDKSKTKGKTPLSYHQKSDRWNQKNGQCHLQCVARGQEFVLSMDEYPESIEWLRSLILK